MCKFYKKMNNIFLDLSVFAMLNAILGLIVGLIYLALHYETIDQIARPTFYVDYMLYILIAIAYGLYTVNSDLVLQTKKDDTRSSKWCLMKFLH